MRYIIDKKYVLYFQVQYFVNVKMSSKSHSDLISFSKLVSNFLGLKTTLLLCCKQLDSYLLATHLFYEVQQYCVIHMFIFLTGSWHITYLNSFFQHLSFSPFSFHPNLESLPFSFFLYICSTQCVNFLCGLDTCTLQIIDLF